MEYKSKTTEYSSWESMKQRCLNPNNKHYKNYGGRGIKVCERWESFDLFLEDMGKKPSKGHSLDRLDVNGDYTKDNCQWSTRHTQDRNRRDNIFIEFEGKKYILMDLAKKVGMHQQTLKARMARMPIEQAVLKNFKYIKKS